MSILAVLLAFVAQAAVVRIEGKEGSWRLTRDGKPYFVRGGGGGGSKALLKEIGGNSFRTWGADKAREELDEAAKYGQTVMLGFWLGHHQHGFDYLDAKALADTERKVLATVKKIKDHPALLCYTLGNEMELGEPHPVEMWKFINALAEKVKAADPNHPVGTVVADIWKEKADLMIRHADALDFVGFNSYGGATSVGRRWRELGGRKPYILTEYGPKGAGECGKAANGLPLEWTSTYKAAWYEEIYEKTILADRGKYCLGGYVFTWGFKNEGSPTWFGTMLPDGTRLEVVASLAKLWGRPVKNRCPEISGLKVSKDAPDEGESVSAAATAKDPEGDRLTWRWALVGEAAHYGEAGLGLAMPQGFDEAIVAGQGTPSVKVRLPGGGKYRLYAYCFDGKGNAAYANWPMVGKGAPPEVKTPVAKTPCAVYDDESHRWYVSGYMGNTGALKVDEACAEKPHGGLRCLKVSYSAADNWAGVFWQDPANDWGDRPGGADLSQATTLRFYARGAKGGEKVTFFMGGIKNDKKHFDTAKAELKDVVLKKTWTRYRIALDGQDLSRVKTAFGFVLGGPAKDFYLDDIEYITE